MHSSLDIDGLYNSISSGEPIQLNVNNDKVAYVIFGYFFLFSLAKTILDHSKILFLSVSPIGKETTCLKKKTLFGSSTNNSRLTGSSAYTKHYVDKSFAVALSWTRKTPAANFAFQLDFGTI